MHLQGYSNYLHFEANRLIVFDNLPICKSAILGRDCIVSFIPIDRQVNEAGYTSRYNTISFTLDPKFLKYRLPAWLCRKLNR